MYNYFISSIDNEVINQKIDEIKDSFKYNFDISKYDLETDSFYNILDEITTISLFSVNKLIIISSGYKLIELDDKKFNAFIEAIGNHDSEYVLIVTDKRKIQLEDEKAIRLKRILSFIVIDPAKISYDDYIKEALNGFNIDLIALNTLKENSIDFLQLKNNIEILKLYKADDFNITLEDVNKMTKKPLNDKVYDLTNALLDNNKTRALECYNDFKLLNIAPSMIISSIITTFQTLFNVYILGVKHRHSKDDIAKYLGVKSGRVYYLIEDAKKFGFEQIKKNLDELNQLDFDIKSGNIDQYDGFINYILK